MSIVRNMELDEIISFYAKRGDSETLCILRHIQEEIEKSIDPDYTTETDEGSDSVSSGSDSEVELDEYGTVKEDIKVNPSLNGFESLA